MQPRTAILWIAMGVAFSPVLADLALHLVASPWARYSLLFPPLALICAVTERQVPPPARDGLVWILLALAIELLAVAGGLTRTARVGLPLAAIGACRLLGLTSLRAALLALWAVPVPDFLHGLTSPDLEQAVARAAAAVVGVFGVETLLADTRFRVGSATLELLRSDGGGSLVALLSGLGWYAAVRLGSPLPACARRAALWGALGIPLQVAAFATAMGLMAAGASSAAARGWLDHGLWPLVALVGLGWAETSRRRSPVAA